MSSPSDSLSSVLDSPDKVLKLDKDLSVEEVEEFFRDSDEEEVAEEEASSSEDTDTEDKFEMLPTEAEKQMFQEDMKQFKAGVAQERQKYQPSTGEKLLAMAKSLILRAIIFYVILWLLRRNSTSRVQPGAGDTNPGPEVDLFEEYEDLPAPGPGNDEL